MRAGRKAAPGVTQETAEAATNFLKSLANPNRLMIVCTLIEGERSVGELEAILGLRQPNLSQQLAALREGGMVEARREAKQVFYRLADPRAVALIATLNEIFCNAASASSAVHSTSTAMAARPRSAEAAAFARVAPEKSA